MIVVIGEALVDLTVDQRGEIDAHLGGGPYNTARTLGRLGVPVGYLGRLSTDVFGRQLRAALGADGVDLRSTVATEEPTTLALAELDGEGHATYRFYIQGTSVPGLTPPEALALLPGQLDALHVGTLGLVLEPLASAAHAVVEAVTGRCLVLVDPNVRPAVIADRGAYLQRLERVIAAANVVKVSDEDLAWLYPGSSPLDMATRLRQLGPQLVLVTLGQRGALAVTAGGVDEVQAPAVTVADTIGAGDSFAGGVLAWWYEHGRPDLGERAAAVEATRFACAVAAITVSRPGADPPRRHELHA